ncbi:uncharacterized protein [Dermacentor andersoni]|uniref:uncharacterized protein isoform X3 n=1 Tax=Dermacentor andersoni TaxID=34620 RepID=UPI002154F85B|nr:putative zinc finger and SCAN domain-containing protein 5D isoform X3 [Dermacentor andersoni]
MDSALVGLSVRALQRKRQAESTHPGDIARRQAAKSQAKAKLLAETPEQREARLARYRVYYQARKRAKTEATATAAVGQQHEQRDEAIDTSNGTHNERLTNHTFPLAAGSTATPRSHRDFTDNPLGSVGNMCERTRHANDLTAVCAGSMAGDSGGLKREVADIPPNTVTAPRVLPRSCLCGQVVSTDVGSQAPGWKVRREVSIQCGLQWMPPLPLATEIFPSATAGNNTDKGTSWNQARRVNQKLCVHEKGSEKLFQCHLCPYASPRLGKLQSHLVSHSTEKPFKCEVCPAAYKSLKCYKAHMCKHTGEKLFQCHLCPYWTVYWKCLLEHRGTHSNAKPFACTVCPFRAKSKANLRRHKLMHGGDAPFKCSVCSLGFRRKHNLKNHMQQHIES